MVPSTVEQYFVAAKDPADGRQVLVGIQETEVYVTLSDGVDTANDVTFSMSRYLFAALCRLGHAAIGDEPVE